MPETGPREYVESDQPEQTKLADGQELKESIERIERYVQTNDDLRNICQEIGLTGLISKKQQEVIDNLEKEFDQFLQTEQGKIWIDSIASSDEEKDQLVKKPEEDDKSGKYGVLRKEILISYRGILRAQKNGELNNSDSMKNFVKSYLLNSFTIITYLISKTTFPQALKASGLGRYHNLESVSNLYSQYAEELGNSAVTLAITSHPKDPQKFLENARTKFKELRDDERFLSLNGRIIKHAVVSNTDSEAYLKKFIETVKSIKLNDRFNDLPSDIINNAAFHKKPVDFLDKVLKASQELSQEKSFASLSTESIIRIVANHPTDPELFLRKFLNIVQELSSDERFKDFDPWVVRQVAMRNPDKSKKFLVETLTKITQLRADGRYSQFSDSNITYVIVNYSKPEARLDEVARVRQDLIQNSRFKDLKPWVINYAILYKQKNYEKFLENVIKISERLKKDSRFESLKPWVIIHAAVHNFEDPDSFLEGFIKNTKRLRENSRFDELDNWVIERAVVRNSSDRDSDIFLGMVLEKYKELAGDDRFQGLDKKEIIHAIVLNVSSPEKMLLSSKNFQKTPDLDESEIEVDFS